MAEFLFDLPETRTNKGADKDILQKVSTKKSAPISVRGGNVAAQIATIVTRVEDRLGKYRDDYLYFMAKDEQKFKEYCYNIKYIGKCAIDTETTGLNVMKDHLVGTSLYTKGQKGLYVPLHHKSYIYGNEIEGQLDPRIVAEQLQMLVDSSVKFEYYNAKFDIRVLRRNLGVYVPAWFDAHLGAMCLNENEPHGLKTLHSKYVLEGKEDEWNFGKLFETISFDLIPIKTAYLYAARDAVDTDELVDFQLPYLSADNTVCQEQGLQGVSNVFWNIEMPCIKAFADMEDNGIKLNLDRAKELGEKYHKAFDEQIANLYSLIDKECGKELEEYRKAKPRCKLSNPINLASPTQLAILIYDILKIEPVDEDNPRGTGEDILEQINHPICKAISEYRTLEKLLSSFLDTLPNEVNTETGKIHCNFNIYGAKTGRISCDSPNLQQIPSHNKEIRTMFEAEDGNVLMSADFSQQEPKVMTAMCQDPKMIQAYKEGKDLYASIASLSFNKSYEDCLEFYLDENGNKTDKTNKEGKERRSSAKSILLGILYGRGLRSVAEQLNTTKKKAQEIQDKIFKGFPAIKKFEEDSLIMAKNEGYVTTFWGRKRRLPNIQLPELEFQYNGGMIDTDPLRFDMSTVVSDIPPQLIRKYKAKMQKAWGKERAKIISEAKAEGLTIIDNNSKIADATRQTVNARIQGSAADMSKKAMVIIANNPRLKELGFKLLLQVHDRLLPYNLSWI